MLVDDPHTVAAWMTNHLYDLDVGLLPELCCQTANRIKQHQATELHQILFLNFTEVLVIQVNHCELSCSYSAFHLSP